MLQGPRAMDPQYLPRRCRVALRPRRNRAFSHRTQIGVGCSSQQQLHHPQARRGGHPRRRWSGTWCRSLPARRTEHGETGLRLSRNSQPLFSKHATRRTSFGSINVFPVKTPLLLQNNCSCRTFCNLRRPKGRIPHCRRNSSSLSGPKTPETRAGRFQTLARAPLADLDRVRRCSDFLKKSFGTDDNYQEPALLTISIRTPWIFAAVSAFCIQR